MKNRRSGLIAVVFSLFAFSIAHADIEFNGVLDYNVTVTYIDSVSITPPGSTFLTPGWGPDSLATDDTFAFTGVPAWPETLALYGTVNAFPIIKRIAHPMPDTWYALCIGSVIPWVKFFGTGYGDVEEPQPISRPQSRLAVSPSVVTGQMRIRLQPVGTERPSVEIHDAVGNVVRSLGCTAGADGIATAAWNREDDRGQLVPEGVYFCRYAASDVIAVRKVLVAR